MARSRAGLAEMHEREMSHAYVLFRAWDIKSCQFVGSLPARQLLLYDYYFTYQYRYKKIMKVRGKKCNEEGTLELIQWPSGLYPFANRGLTGSWTDQLNQLINQ